MVTLRTRTAHVLDGAMTSTGTVQADLTKAGEIQVCSQQGDTRQETGSQPRPCPGTSHTSAVGGLGSNHHLFLQAPHAASTAQSLAGWLSFRL